MLGSIIRSLGLIDDSLKLLKNYDELAVNIKVSPYELETVLCMLWKLNIL